MTTFGAVLVAMFVGVLIFTFTAVARDGWNLFIPFTANIIAMNWSGQFNVDFMSYLLLSALWTAWRHHFSRPGIVIAAFALVLGILLFVPYVLVASVQAQGDVKRLLLGERNQTASSLNA